MGSAPSQLRGTTINGMMDYGEGELFHEIGQYTIGGVAYKLAQCALNLQNVASVCLVSSGEHKLLFSSKKFKSVSFIDGDKAEMTRLFNVDASQYAFAVAHAGSIDGEERYFMGRVLRIKLTDGNRADWTFLDKDGTWTRDLDGAAAIDNRRFADSEGANWKIMNSYSVDGTLYMFITRLHDYQRTGDQMGRLTFKDASVIKSTDRGRTWTRPAEDNRRRPMFPGQRFGAPYFVWYGKDGAASVDNADRYVYAISNDGYWESGDNFVVGRVSRKKLADLSAVDWSFYRSGDGTRDGSWTSDLNQAQPVLSDPAQAGMAGATYIEGLGRYVMVTWHYPSHGWRDVLKNGDTRTVLEFFEAPHPWGPWTRFKTFKTDGLGWYTPIIGQRFQTVVSPSAVKALFYASATIMNPSGGVNWEHYRKHYKLNFIPITLSTVPIKNSNPLFAGGR